MRRLNYPSLSCTHTHVCAHTSTRALNPQICKGISTFDWGSLCTNGTSVCRGTIRGGFDLLTVWLGSDSQGRTTMADLMGNDVARREEATLLRKDKCSTFQSKQRTYCVDKTQFLYKVIAVEARTYCELRVFLMWGVLTLTLTLTWSRTPAPDLFCQRQVHEIQPQKQFMAKMHLLPAAGLKVCRSVLSACCCAFASDQDLRFYLYYLRLKEA